MWKSWKFWTVWATLGGLIGLFAFGFTTDPKKVPSPLIGHEAPNFQLINLWNGESVELSALRGKPVVLNFWASWCVECQQEAHILEAFHKRYGETVPPQVHILGVAIQDKSAQAQALHDSLTKRTSLASTTPMVTSLWNMVFMGCQKRFLSILKERFASSKLGGSAQN